MNKAFKTGFIKRAMEYNIPQKHAEYLYKKAWSINDMLDGAGKGLHNGLAADANLASQDHMAGGIAGGFVGGAEGAGSGLTLGAGLGGLLGLANDKKDENGETHRLRHTIRGLLGGGALGAAGGGLLGAGAGGMIGYNVPSYYDKQ